MTAIFQRRVEGRILSSENPAEVWSDWQSGREKWLFVAAHDDDIVCGAGLTFLAAVANGISVHAAVVSNGRMGYCSAGQRHSIVKIRKREASDSFRLLGLPEGRLDQFDYDDGNLAQEAGRRFSMSPNDSNAIGGGVGLQNTMTWLLRKVAPTRIFMPNRLDLHPDHRVTNSELVISVFHAQGTIWPELGDPIESIPKLYEYTDYSDFAQPPDMRVLVSEDLARKRIEGIDLFKSQGQIELLTNRLRKSGGTEYLLEIAFDIFQAEKYETLFSDAARTDKEFSR